MSREKINRLVFFVDGLANLSDGELACSAENDDWNDYEKQKPPPPTTTMFTTELWTCLYVSWMTYLSLKCATKSHQTLPGTCVWYTTK